MKIASRYMKLGLKGDEKMKIHEKIKKYMDENGIKQKYISDNSNIPENTLSMILNGKRKLYADEMVEIFKALGVDANTILFLKETELDG